MIRNVKNDFMTIHMTWRWFDYWWFACTMMSFAFLFVDIAIQIYSNFFWNDLISSVWEKTKYFHFIYNNLITLFIAFSHILSEINGENTEKKVTPTLF